ncbi:hypothetical protein C8R45DRAFT_1065334, partial [Mycena sanguinolenta]
MRRNLNAYPPPTVPIAMRTSTSTWTSFSSPSRRSSSSSLSAAATSASSASARPSIESAQLQAHEATPLPGVTLLSWTSTGKAKPEPSTNTSVESGHGNGVRRRISRVLERFRPNTPSQSQSSECKAKAHTSTSTRNGNGNARAWRRTRTPSPSPPVRTLPELPPELWILILEYSTYPSSPSFDSPAFDAPLSPSSSLEPALDLELPSSLAFPSSLELPSTFLSPALTPASLAPRRAYYRRAMAHKRTLALVSREWNQYAQPVLYEAIWITRAAQARALALTLLCQAGWLPPAPAPSSSASSTSGSSTASGSGDSSTKPRPSTSHTDSSVGRFIRRLHIETPALERCAPADLRTILAYAPGLEVYSDFRSVRLRPPGAPAELLGALAMGGALKRLSWTNYDDPALVGLGVGLGMPMG